MNQQNTVQYDPLMNQHLVARFNLQGELLLETDNAQALQVDKTLLLLQQQKRLSQEIAVVWVPTQQVILTQVQVPGKRRSHWMAALPFALEESLSSSIDNYHILALNRNKSEQVSAMVVDIELMQYWQASLAEYGLQKAILVADCFRIEWQVPQNNIANQEVDDSHEAATWLVSDSADSANHHSKPANAKNYLVRTGQYLGLAANEAWFNVFKKQSEKTLNKSISEQFINKTQLLTSSKKSLIKIKAFSLSQGEFSADSSFSFNWFEWRWVAALSVAVLSLIMFTQWQQTQTLQKQAAYTKEQTEILFKTLFPESKRIVNIKAQTLNKLKQASASQADAKNLMPILNQLAPLMKKQTKVKLIELVWSPRKTDALQLKLNAPSSAELERLNSQIKKVLPDFRVRLNLKNVTNELAEGVLYVAAN